MSETTTLIKDANLVLEASSAKTSTTTGTGIAIGPTGLVEAQIVVSTYADTPTIQVKIQQSDSLNGTYTAFADQIASSAAIAPVAATDCKIYRLPFIATKAYVRAYITHSDSDSITYGIYVTTPGN